MIITQAITSGTSPLEAGNPIAIDTSELPNQPVRSASNGSSSLEARRDANTGDLPLPQSSTTAPDRIQPHSARRPRITGLYKWEGRILEIDGDLFTAEIYPMDHQGPTVIADFSLRQLNSDAQAAEPGDVFYVTVRTIADKYGYEHRTESIRAQRLGRWTADEVRQLRQDAAAEMEKLEDLFD